VREDRQLRSDDTDAAIQEPGPLRFSEPGIDETKRGSFPMRQRSFLGGLVSRQQGLSAPSQFGQADSQCRRRFLCRRLVMPLVRLGLLRRPDLLMIGSRRS
jgi:hypothetical protein